MKIIGLLSQGLAWLGASWLDVLLILLAIGLMLYLYKSGRKDAVKRMILYLVVQAEKQLGSGTGALKFEMVLTEVYNRLPLLLRILVSKQQICDWIEEAVAKMKAYLSENDANLLDLNTEQALLKAISSKDPASAVGESSGA